MYKVYVNDTICIYDPEELADTSALIDPVLTMQDNAAGSFEFTISPENAGYSAITRLSSVIRVYEDRELLWEGRVISDTVDFWNNRKISAEGCLSWCNDTIQPMAEYVDVTPTQFLNTLFGYHNAYATNHQFWIGNVTVTGTATFQTNYETTMDCLKDKLIDVFGGHLQVRYENGNRYLDYLADYTNESTQEIRFAENLIDFVQSWDASEYATVVLPLGDALDSSPIEGLTAYLTVSDVNSGSPYIINTDTVASYGWIAKVVRFDNVDDPNALYILGLSYLADQQFDAMELEMTAADLHLLDATVESFRLLDLVHCVSVPHGMNRYFPITKIELHVDAPEATVYTLGAKLVQPLTAQFRRL